MFTRKERKQKKITDEKELRTRKRGREKKGKKITKEMRKVEEPVRGWNEVSSY